MICSREEAFSQKKQQPIDDKAEKSEPSANHQYYINEDRECNSDDQHQHQHQHYHEQSNNEYNTMTNTDTPTESRPPPVIVHKTANSDSDPLQQQQQQQQQQQVNGHKDHYSYTYSYKTAGDGLNSDGTGMPGVSSVEVNESVTEEIGPDGSKIIRRHQQEKQINKITQVVTQRVIKRQYIDPQTGQIIEYDPNNELFANLPPETVFEEHTVISDDNGSGQPPVITTMSTSSVSANQNKTSPANQKQPIYGGTRRIENGAVDSVDNARLNG